MKALVAGFVAVLGLALAGALLMDGSDDPSRNSIENASTDTSSSGSPTTSPTSPTASSAASSPGVTSTSSSTPSGSSAPEPVIATSERFYFGESFETIHILGTYEGVDGSARLRVQLRHPGGWTWFPLPVITKPNGEFSAFVELEAGQYRVRIIDPETGVSSRIVTLLVV